MGIGWRIVSETVRQKTGITTDKHFTATSNGRNEAMFTEATEFAEHMRLLEKDLKQLHRQVEVHFKNIRHILIQPVPRAYDEGASGPAPLQEEVVHLGAGVDVELFPKAAEEARKRLEMEVMQPIREWLKAYRAIAERMKTLDNLRLELDSRRRTVGNLQGRLERVKSTLGTTKQKGQEELKIIEDTIIHKDEKRQRTMAAYIELERTVYNSLFTVVRDTVVLREYTCVGLQIVMDCFKRAAEAYSDGANPQFSSNVLMAGAPGGGAVMYGTVAQQQQLAQQQMPPLGSDSGRFDLPMPPPSSNGDAAPDKNARGLLGGIKELFKAKSPRLPRSPAPGMAAGSDNDPHDQMNYGGKYTPRDYNAGPPMPQHYHQHSGSRIPQMTDDVPMPADVRQHHYQPQPAYQPAPVAMPTHYMQPQYGYNPNQYVHNDWNHNGQ